MAEHIENTPLTKGLGEYREATESDFDRLDRAFYETATVDFTAGGFQILRDLASVSPPRSHSVIRSFLGDGGTTIASACQNKVFGFARILRWLRFRFRGRKILEFQSELTDGTFILTTTAPVPKEVIAYPFIDRWPLDRRMPCSAVIAMHRDHVKDVLAGRPGVILMRFQSYAECRASADRLHRLRIAFGKSPRVDYRAEWEAMFGQPLGDPSAAPIDVATRQLPQY